jgi:hypothetical protein
MPPEAKYRQFGLLTFLSGVVRHLLDRRRAAATSCAPLTDYDFINGKVDGREGTADHGGDVIVAFVRMEVGIARLDLANAGPTTHVAVFGGKDAAVLFEQVDEVVRFDGVAGGVADRHREFEGERVFAGITGFDDVRLEPGVMAEEAIECAVAVAGAAAPFRKIKGLLHDLGLQPVSSRSSG